MLRLSSLLSFMERRLLEGGRQGGVSALQVWWWVCGIYLN